MSILPDAPPHPPPTADPRVAVCVDCDQLTVVHHLIDADGTCVGLCGLDLIRFTRDVVVVGNRLVITVERVG